MTEYRGPPPIGPLSNWPGTAAVEVHGGFALTDTALPDICAQRALTAEDAGTLQVGFGFTELA